MNYTKEQTLWLNKKLSQLKTSKFRSSFHLRKYMLKYIDEKGLDIIEKHCDEFINNNLKIYNEEKDGHQTPTKNHPVFIAQHATATCCRECIEKWYHIPKEKELNESEIKCIKAIIMEWIKSDINNSKNKSK